MALNLNHMILCFALTLTAATLGNAIQYVVYNNALSTLGGSRFDKEIGVEYVQQTLFVATNFIDTLFGLNNNVAAVSNVTITVENIDGVAFATSDNIIHVSAGYIERYPGRDIKADITGVIYHEMVHILLFNGNHTARPPSGLVEGMADFVRLRAGYVSHSWAPVGVGFKWDQGYEVTAYFLDFCQSIRLGFVADLNKLIMQHGYSESYFHRLLGMPVSQLWANYKTFYDLTN
ncbi:hypothetical protein PIB30_062200 [Stylosanthes scabra]|uniref:Uncharacterized protein n=1 Tax=Stylosanthes scabra TaxID=79078 RepID=A0ABU6VNF6_9FABA|nr:hypothetical protein [Stylosanthes scabra]